MYRGHAQPLVLPLELDLESFIRPQSLAIIVEQHRYATERQADEAQQAIAPTPAHDWLAIDSEASRLTVGIIANRYF